MKGSIGGSVRMIRTVYLRDPMTPEEQKLYDEQIRARKKRLQEYKNRLRFNSRDWDADPNR